MKKFLSVLFLLVVPSLVQAQGATIVDGQAAENAIGLPDLSTELWNQVFPVATTQDVYLPVALAYDADEQILFVHDIGSNRVLVFDGSAGWTSTLQASWVLYQPDFTTGGFLATGDPGYTASNGGLIQDIAYDDGGNRLFVADATGNRVLVFEFGPNVATGISNGMAATVVLGQPGFTTSTINADTGDTCAVGTGPGITTACGFRFPRGVEWDATGNRLFVADQDNRRVVVHDFDGRPLTNGRRADNVLGQVDEFNRSGGGINNPNAVGEVLTFSVAIDEARELLYVSQWAASTAIDYSRIVIYDVSTVTTGEPAVGVIGQVDLVSNDVSSPASASFFARGATGRGSSLPLNIDAGRDLLWVSDLPGHRALAFPLAGGATSAVHVLGQPDFTTTLVSNACGGGGTTVDPNACGTGSDTFPGNGAAAVQAVANNQLLLADATRGIMVFDFTQSENGSDIEVTGDVSTETSVNGSGDTEVDIDTVGNNFVVTLPAGSAPLSPANAIEIEVTDGFFGLFPGVELNLSLPSGETKTVQLPRGSGSRLCIDDSPGATIDTLSFFCSGLRVRKPANTVGSCRDWGTPGVQQVCTVTPGVLEVTGLENSAVYDLRDGDGDGVDDAGPNAEDVCLDTDLAGPVPTQFERRASYLTDAELLTGSGAGCNASDVIACFEEGSFLPPWVVNILVDRMERFGVPRGTQRLFKKRLLFARDTDNNNIPDCFE